jgi:hypothetical protein
MNWAEQRGNLEVSVVLAAAFYVATTYLPRSLHPTGTLSWQARRMRNGGTLFLLLFFSGLEVASLHGEADVSLTVAVILCAVLGVLFLLLVRWWWQDARKEKAAQEALVEKLHQEGRELVAPPMSTGRKAWRWVVNGYAIFLVAALVYGLIRYLVRHY